jgi:hypothetical protein
MTREYGTIARVYRSALICEIIKLLNSSGYIRIGELFVKSYVNHYAPI